MALLAGGGHAELVAVHASHTLSGPEHVIAGRRRVASSRSIATAHDALFTQAELKPGERLLVNGAAGGVGVAAVQLGVALGAQVTGTARHHAARAGGARREHEPERCLRRDPRARRRRQPRDESGAARTPRTYRRDRHGRRLGGDAELRPADAQARPHPRLDAALPRAREEKADVIRRLGGRALPLLARRAIVVPVEKTFPLERAQDAYERFAAGGKFGKIVIAP